MPYSRRVFGLPIRKSEVGDRKIALLAPLIVPYFAIMLRRKPNFPYEMTKDKVSAEAEHAYAVALASEMRPGDLSQPLAAAPTLGQREFLKSAGVPLTYS